MENESDWVLRLSSPLKRPSDVGISYEDGRPDKESKVSETKGRKGAEITKVKRHPFPPPLGVRCTLSFGNRS